MVVTEQFKLKSGRSRVPKTNAERNEMFRMYPASFRHAALLRDEAENCRGTARDNQYQQGKWPDKPWTTAALTWVVGNKLEKLGETSAAIVTYRGRRNVHGLRNILQLPLQRVHARASEGKVKYDDVRAEYQLGFVTHPGANGRIVDGCINAVGINDSGTKERYDWACNGIALLGSHREVLRRNQEDAYTIPHVPQILVGFSSPDVALFAGSAAKKAVAAVTNTPADMSDDELQVLLRSVVAGKTVREALCVPLHNASDMASKWLVRQEWLAYVGSNVPIFEDFSSLCGVLVENPFKYCKKRLRIHNPAKLAAQNVGIDLKAMLAVYTDAARNSNTGIGRATGSEQTRDITDEILDVIYSMIIPSVRKILGRLSASYCDDAILKAVMHPNRELEQVDGLPLKSDAQKLDYGFGYIATKMPHLLNRVTNEDMLQAFARPNFFMYARNACMTQHIMLDAYGHARYSSHQLGRPRVSVDML